MHWVLVHYSEEKEAIFLVHAFSAPGADFFCSSVMCPLPRCGQRTWLPTLHLERISVTHIPRTGREKDVNKAFGWEF